jgi:flagellar biosynthesis/type III secretory pathway protein FliH
MMRKLLPHEGQLVVPLSEAPEHARHSARIQQLIERSQAFHAARSELELELRTRLPALVRGLLLTSEHDLEARVLALVEQELVRLRAASTLRVRIHPRWLDLVRKLEPWKALSERDAQVELEPDAELGENDVVIYSNLGDVDACIDTRVQTFVEALLAPRSAR